jgi:DNA-directed RNA polymerase specialized sigma24 family protein
MARALERKTYTRIPENQEPKVVRLYLDGWSAAQIGAEFGTTIASLTP